ncbi:MAG: glucose 1-dehydrogenase [Planctomycetota bacterium]|nr:glucose 1-dehydrogenase [Planctomycetota bacterium]
MKAIAIHPQQKSSGHLRDIEKPRVKDIPNGKGVLVKLLKVGVDATDKEIIEAYYGKAPEGDDYLVLGHECFGVVEEVGDQVTQFRVGDYVTATVRRPGTSIFDDIGTNDMTSDDEYFERGICNLHGYLTEYFVEDEEYVVRVPDGITNLHCLMEPMSVVAKAIWQMDEVQRRLKVWKPKLAFVMGAGQIGLLATLFLRLRGCEVYTIARSEGPNIKSEICDGYGATYISTKEKPVEELIKEVGRPDVIIEATGSSHIAFKSLELVGKNGCVVWTSLTIVDQMIEIPADRINQEWVLGNKVLVGSVNGNRGHFEMGIEYLALGEATYPGVTEKILTHPVQGFDNYQELIRLLVEDKSALKVYLDIADA